jgi:hypothetical protein
LESPLYAAVIEYVSAARVLVLKVATPLPFRLAVPNTVDPLENIMVPVGAALPAVCVTDALRVTFDPTSDWDAEGVALTLSVVVVAFNVGVEATVSISGAEVEPSKFASPAYVAVME